MSPDGTEWPMSSCARFSLSCSSWEIVSRGSNRPGESAATRRWGVSGTMATATGTLFSGATGSGTSSPSLLATTCAKLLWSRSRGEHVIAGGGEGG